MKKQFVKTLLWGLLATAAAGTFVSCNYDDDIDELNNRVSGIEGLIGDLRNAISAGSMVTNVETDATSGVKTIMLSDGNSIVLAAGVKVTENPDNVVITVDGKDYVLPKGAAAASLIYRPVYNDGVEVIKDMKPISVNFLISGDVFEASAVNEVSIVDAYALQTRGASNLLEAIDGVKVDGNVVTVEIKAAEGLEAEAGKTINANVRIKAGSKEYISNYFQINVDKAFTYDNAAPQDQVDAFAAADGVNATIGEAGASKLITFADPLASMEGEINFADFFKGLPEGAKFVIGAQETEEGTKAFDALRNSMGKDGKFKWAQRPGTAFPNGFRVTVQNKEGQTLGKADFIFNDPLDGLDFSALCGLSGNFEAELYGRDGRFVKAGDELNIPEIFQNYETEIPADVRHGNSEAWFAAWQNYSVKNAAGEEIIGNYGAGPELNGDFKGLVAHSRGILWYYRGFMLVVPETIATEDGKYTASNGKQYSGGEGFDYDTWGSGNPVDYVNSTDWYGSWGAHDINIASFGITMDEKTGIVKFPANYTGWGVRMAFSGAFEYDYGVKDLTGDGADQYGMLFINRRVAADGSTMFEEHLK